ncbi:PaaI family thioesterase [Endozoicomonas lisbonensis]|uniref:Acyl-coenzyme A thioesterase PaaI-like protein n=1 Tax=Endozoicomonas lisbonensis TaxID=3120522 RepID=A0ABV2SMI7_9GAMM
MADMEKLLQSVEEARNSRDYAPLCQHIPYARKIGMSCQSDSEGALFLLPGSEKNIGNPMLPAIHGGVVGGFMEMAAAAHLMLFMDEPRTPKMIDFSLDYLRSSRVVDTFARCEVVRQGNRVANVMIKAWQADPSAPVAIGRAHFKLSHR